MPDIAFLKSLDAPPKAKTMIHALAPPGASAKALAQFAQAFGVEAPRPILGQDPDRFTYTAGQQVFSLFKASGAVRYQDRARWQVDDGKANVKLGDAEAEKLARAVISKHKLATSSECNLLKVTRLTVGDASVETKKGSERVIDVGVAFQRTVSGVPVDGPGGKLIIYLDHEGTLTGFDRIWRPIKAVQAPVKELRNPKLAEKDLQRYWKAHEGGRIEVQEVRFGYFELGYRDAQRVLQPAYIMPLTLVGPDDKVRMKSVHVFPAATNAVGRLMPPPKKPVSLPARQK
jgi:hypothetical protein